MERMPIKLTVAKKLKFIVSLFFLAMVMDGLSAREKIQVLQESSTHFLTLGIIIQVTLFLFAVSFICFLIQKKNKLIDHDPVTGMESFSTFEKNVRKVLSTAEPNEYIILSFNIDNLSLINESFGIHGGNEVLRRVGKHLEECCGPREFTTRYFADNFIFFTRNPDFFWNIEERVYEMTNINTLLQDMLPEKYSFTFTSSVYYIDNPSDTVESMVDRANLAQKLCHNRYSTHRVIEYTSEMKNSHEWKREVTLTMENALDNEEFEVYYQPKFRFDNETIMGAEALIRWNNPNKGFLAPAKFVPLFEDNGFIEKIDKFVFNKVCSFLDLWNRNHQGQGPSLTISFNLSRYHLFNPNLIKELKNIADQYDIGQNRIEVELTETVMFDNPKKLIKVMTEIKNAGFLVSIDDFGSGYSSLNLLKNMPADVIKLDKEFLSASPENSKENIIITSVINMAKQLNIKTVAEGVETRLQSDMLKKIGCDIAQGFFYAKPMCESDFRKLLIQKAAV